MTTLKLSSIFKSHRINTSAEYGYPVLQVSKMLQFGRYKRVGSKKRKDLRRGGWVDVITESNNLISMYCRGHKCFKFSHLSMCCPKLSKGQRFK